MGTNKKRNGQRIMTVDTDIMRRTWTRTKQYKLNIVRKKCLNCLKLWGHPGRSQIEKGDSNQQKENEYIEKNKQYR